MFFEDWFVNNCTTILNKRLRNALDANEQKRLEKVFFSNILWFYLQKLKNNEIDQEIEEIFSFYSFVRERIRTSHAQLFQDLWVLYMLQEKRNGFFVEFGACDGKRLSNTLLLEELYGWRGILAEPNPCWHQALKNNRPLSHISFQCVYKKSGASVSFCHTLSMPELSRIETIRPDDVHERNGNREKSEILTVDTISLQDLLEKYHAPHFIDYLSIDTEGSEYEILEAFDFSKYTFGLITVEHAGEMEKRKKIHQLLKKHSYKRWHTEVSRWDDWYVYKGEYHEKSV